jgi:histidinol-phosphate aminotransferase
MNFRVEKLMQPAIKNFQPYQAKHYPGVIKMDANENPYPWPKGLKEAALAQVSFNRYPDSESTALRDKISGYIGVGPEKIMVGNGSDELIQILLMAFGGLGTKTIMASPTFTMYSLATTYTGGQAVEVPLINGDTLDIPGLIAAAQDPQARSIIICNPNNPTGNCFPLEDIRQVIQGTDKLVIVDEAYYEFSGSTLVGELGNFPNLVVLRTLSKAFGMAALRIGYLMAGVAVIDVLARVRQPYNSNSFSQACGTLAFEHLPEFQAQVRDILAERDKLVSFLQGLELERVYASDANFILFKPKNKAKEIFEGLLKQKVLIRYMGNLPVVGETLRVSPGLPEENLKFMDALGKTLGGGI